jgi:hypothetical protein
MSLVTGSFKLANGQPYIGQVVFRPLSTPLTNNADLVVTGDIVCATDSQGQLTQELEPGFYSVLAGSSTKPVFKISVPNSGSANILNLVITAVNTSGAFAWHPGDVVPFATSTVIGGVRTHGNAGDPVVYLQSESDALFALQTPAAGTYRVKNGTTLQVYNSTTGKYHTLFLTGPDGAVTVQWGPGES